jgi:polysaccharide biosynthesis protein PslG
VTFALAWWPTTAVIATTGSKQPFRYCAKERSRFTGRHDFLGVTAWVDIAPGTVHYRDCAFGLMAADHIGIVRFELDWAGVEPSPGEWDFSGYDAIETLLAEHHLTWMPILMDAPPFASKAPNAKATGLYPPRRDAQYAKFVSLAVKRYGPHGSFWKSNPKLPYYPVRAWQLWNEPNLNYYWEPRPVPSAYARLLIAGSKAVRSADRHAEVVTAGMPYSSLGYPLLKYWAGLLRAGAGGYFDAAAINTYAHAASAAFNGVVNLRRFLNRSGARGKRLWITEFGWAVGGPPGIFTVGRSQGRAVASFLRDAERERGALRLQQVFYYDWRDVPVPRGRFNWWGLHTGLYGTSSVPEPAASVIASFARKLNR